MAKLFNGGHEPLVPAGRWGEGVVLPGEAVDATDPSTWPPPWTQDKAQAQAAARAYAEASTTYPPSPKRRKASKAGSDVQGAASGAGTSGTGHTDEQENL